MLFGLRFPVEVYQLSFWIRLNHGGRQLAMQAVVIHLL